MSAISQSIRFKLGDFCRHLFQKPARRSDPVPAAATAVVPAPVASHSEPNASGVAIPLRAVLAAFPLELRGRIRPMDSEGLTLTVPLHKVLPELASGAVKMRFGEIRRLAPQAFTPGLAGDDAQVILPLNEILARLDPSMLARRPMQQKAAALPEEILSPFAGRGAGLTISAGNGKPAAARNGRAACDPVPEAAAGRTASLPVPAVPLAPVTPVAIMLPDPDERPLFVRKPPMLTPEAAPTSPGTPPTPPPAWPPKSKDYLAAPPVARAMQPARSDAPAPASTSTDVLIAALATIAAAWPEALRQEIVHMNRGDAQLALPVDLLEASLKRGRVTFAWKMLRCWISPAVPPELSPHDATELELPLSVVAPLFLARQKETGPSQRVSVDATIPDLFFGLPKPEPAPTSKQADTNTQSYVWAENSDTVQMEEERCQHPKPPGAERVARHATPNEIVSRALALDGVVGALIALPEGLLVAGRVPAGFNGDTLAAFLPQIFSKLSQTTKELRLGDVNNLTFTVGSVPWNIFRVKALFFAAFGDADGHLPHNELARLAAELNHRR